MTLELQIYPFLVKREIESSGSLMRIAEKNIKILK